MNVLFNKIYNDKLTAWSFSISAGLWLLSLLVLGIFYRMLPPYLPLYNKMAWGYERLGNTYEVFLILGLVLLYIIVNTYLGIAFRIKMPLLTRFLFITMISMSIFTAIFIVKLLLVIL